MTCNAMSRLDIPMSASDDGRPGGQDESREVRAGLGRVFIKDSSRPRRGVAPRDRLRLAAKPGATAFGAPRGASNGPR